MNSLIAKLMKLLTAAKSWITTVQFNTLPEDLQAVIIRRWVDRPGKVRSFYYGFDPAHKLRAYQKSVYYNGRRIIRIPEPGNLGG